MTDDHQNTSQDNRQAIEVEHSGNCRGPLDSSQKRWEFSRFISATVLVAFVLNEIWEMSQMSGYVEMAGRPWMSTLALCTKASVGDVGIILGIYGAGALAAGDLRWGLRNRWNIYAAAALLGLFCATLVEYSALGAGRWSYTERMPMVPVLGAGLWPLLQMTLLPPLTFWIAQWWARRST